MLHLLLPILLLQVQEPIERKVDVARQIIIVVNENVPASIEIGEYYAQRRAIPATQICRVNGSREETITWPDFRKTILGPVTEFLKTRPDVLYIVPTYGVPVKTSEEHPEKNGKGGDPYNASVVGRDYCCIDRELELIKKPHDLEGWINSETFKVDRHITLDDGIYIVSRLDGPTPECVKALVDNAIYGETYGIEGTCLLDTRGMKEDGSYGSIDCEMKQIKDIYEKYGFTFKHDDEEPVVKLGTIPNQAHYWGWYTGDFVGNTDFKFVRGAVGAHLHSFSAGVMRSKNQTWTGPLVYHGITGTCGTVYEPLSVGFPFGTTFLERFFHGYTFGESMQMANMYTSWQAVFVGDPLYAPYAKGMKDSQAKNRKCATEGAAELERLLDKGDLDGAKKISDALSALPIRLDGAKDSLFLVRELRARKLAKKPATGSISDLRAALAAPKKALSMSEFNFDANLALGRQLLKEGSARSALENLQRAVQVDPADGAAQFALGLALKELNQHAEALAAFEAALAADGNPECAREIGEILFRQKKYEEAAKRLDPAFARSPGDHALAILVARCQLALAAPAKAVAALESAVKEPPAGPSDVESYAECWENLLKANKSAGNRDKADLCEKYVAGLAARRNVMKVKSAPIDQAIQDTLKQKTPTDLPALPTYDDKFVGLPSLYLANRGDWEVSIFVSGPIASTCLLHGIRGATKPKTIDLPLFPGKYKILVIARKDQQAQVFYREAVVDVSKNYSLGVDRDLKLYRADKP